MAETGAGDDGDMQIWDDLLKKQTEIYRRTSEQNAQLRNKVSDLERELNVWKAALKAADEREAGLQKSVKQLEGSIGALTEDNPIVACFIDGDGNLFKEDLLRQGHVGGRQAALLLTTGLTEYAANIDPGLARRAQVWLTVYFNKSGLLDVMQNQKICTMEQFEAFLLGFNQASPLFSIVDVGGGKEAADVKNLCAYSLVFLKYGRYSLAVRYTAVVLIRRTLMAFYAGCHDNGYNTTLTRLENEGYLHKIVLLPGYNILASELKRLALPSLEIEVFMTRKIVPKKISPTILPQDIDKVKSSSSGQAINRSLSPVKANNQKVLDPSADVSKLKPPPCNYFYLSECKSGPKCKYAHDYVMTPKQVSDIRNNAAKTPCPKANRNQKCTGFCIFGHTCPKGPQCYFFKQGKCKFAGANMHESPDTPAPMSRPTSTGSSVASVNSLGYLYPTVPTPRSPMVSQTQFLAYQNQLAMMANFSAEFPASGSGYGQG
ncbi:hypothetical protein PUNSTDRAFT_140193 [Punctularia strigosozonata HHB-11173 SS5]|uniref:uncharacterized protein n=1 Tax=Punctularia strigosozonata (strain HHB-11173) TaxID=741275 RepID=UPI00044165F2|nr:uncharacterized protein PUNSTDRAFT_140193 [Punctularia strigosozonata HHB-11173 SS5]EIN13714.1 hypothetical protein PUNSTDRAFT_140193 [Punctularia strigosozonata HHB-11173 SS5]